MRRPPLISSSVSAILAISAGLRKPVQTSGPIFDPVGDGRDRAEHRPAFPGAGDLARFGAVEQMVGHPDRIEPAVLGGADERGGFLPTGDALGFGKMRPTLTVRNEDIRGERPLGASRVRAVAGIVRVSGCGPQASIRPEYPFWLWSTDRGLRFHNNTPGG